MEEQNKLRYDVSMIVCKIFHQQKVFMVYIINGYEKNEKVCFAINHNMSQSKMSTSHKYIADISYKKSNVCTNAQLAVLVHSHIV